MTGVTLRCPNCGTTKSTPGECDACHEAQVRYYCTNHKPGRWLDAPACPQCGAKFGDPLRQAAPPPPLPPRPTVSPSPDLSRTGSVRPPPAPGRAPWGRRERAPAPDRTVEAAHDSASVRAARTARMLEILRAASRAGRRPRDVTYVPEAPPAGAAFGGCLMRFIVLVMFMLIVFSFLLSMVGGSLIQMFGGYYY
jgi:hypothetical protein